MISNSNSKNEIGICGEIISSAMSNSGVISGMIEGTDSVGAVIGYLFDQADISSVYSSSSLTVSALSNVGGLIGEAYFNSPTNTTIQNSYSQATIQGEQNLGGLFGKFCFSSQNNILSLINMYTTSPVINTTTDISSVCSVIGRSEGPATKKFVFEFTFSSVYYDTSVNPLIQSISGAILGTNGSPIGNNIQSIILNAEETFDQCNI